MAKGKGLKPTVTLQTGVMGKRLITSSYAATCRAINEASGFGVLEHVEPRFFDDVLAHMAGLCRLAAIVSVHHGPSKVTLPNGSNAHITIQPREWWFERLKKNFGVRKVYRFDDLPEPYSVFLLDKMVRAR